jgi:thymidylate kinase
VFITLEGPDGSGKSSLLARVGAALRDRGCDVVTTREPGSTPLGEQVRRLVLDTEPQIDRTGRADARSSRRRVPSTSRRSSGPR